MATQITIPEIRCMVRALIADMVTSLKSSTEIEDANRLESLNLDSLDIADLVVALNDHFDIDIPDVYAERLYEESATVGDVIALVARLAEGKA